MEDVTNRTGATSSSSTDLLGMTRTLNSVSGQAMPVGDIPGWDQVFTDDFTTNVPLGSFPGAVADTWGRSYPDGWVDTSGNGKYFPSKVVSIGNGMMNMHLHTEGGVHMVAAPVPTIPGATGPGGGQLYGRYVVRFRADSLRGYKTAWLLWPDSEKWPTDGEINFPEGNLDNVMHGYIHPQGATTGDHSHDFVTRARYAPWHTAVTEWAPGRITFKIDGQVIGTATDRIPNTPMHWVLQTETTTSAGVVPADSTAGNVQIDWVAVYKLSNRSVVLDPLAPNRITRTVATRVAGRAARSLVPPRVHRLRAMGGVRLRVNAPAPGVVVTRLTTRRAKRTLVLGKASTHLTRKGAKTVTIRLNRSGRLLLKRRKKALVASLAVTYRVGTVIGKAKRTVRFRPQLPNPLPR